MHAQRERIPLRIVVVDKTVPFRNWLEHRSLFWLLEHLGVVRSDRLPYDLTADYLGAYPPEKPGDPPERTRDLAAADLVEADLLYFADTYGVYEEDLASGERMEAALERSPRIYGGTTPAEAEAARAFVAAGGTAIAEVNALGSPTESDAREAMETLFGVRWTHWIGRYFTRLEDREEVPGWLRRVYEAEWKTPWRFEGPGYVLTRDDCYVEVLRVGKESGMIGLTIERDLPRDPAMPPEFSDSEMLTLMLAIDCFEFTSERRYVEFVRANYWALFPKLLDQSQYNRRARSLRYLLNALRKDWAAELGVQFEHHFLLDTTPVIAVGYRRDKRHSDFRASAEYGYCAARRLKYFGYKLVMLTTLDGTPYAFELVPANTDELDAADEILDTLPPDSHAWSDKGFLDEEWQTNWSGQGIHVWTTKCENQRLQNPAEFDRLLNSVRERVEGTFDILKEGGRSVEHTLAHTLGGLCARIIAKIASVTLRLFLRFFGIDVLTYTVSMLDFTSNVYS